MNELKARTERVLSTVERPGRYIGGEWNAIVKDPSGVDVRFAFAFPDTYEIGMSHLGLQIVYHILNQRSDTLCERTFQPWLDMEQVMRREAIPLYTLESFTPVREFDVVGFSIQYELCYTTVLNMLDLAGIPILSAERTASDPLVVVGGCGSQTPEPMADFIDIFFNGDAEDTLDPFIDEFKQARELYPDDRMAQIKHLVSHVESLYAPALYEPTYNPDGTLVSIAPTCPEAPEVVAPAIVRDFANAPFPTKPIVPNIETIHDRIMLEIMRGCPQACRFCQAGMTKLPLRYRPPELLAKLAEESYRNTGHDEISLVSLSTSDYPKFKELLIEMTKTFEGRKVNISLPSLRVNEQVRQVPTILSAVRKSSLTLAPEVATDRLRKIIHKNVLNESLYEAVRESTRMGWNRVKVYFMVGLPDERQDDVKGIVDMAYTISDTSKAEVGRPCQVSVSVSTFVPKPFTPFQWDPMISIEQTREKHKYLRSLNHRRSIRLKLHDPERSYLEGVFARGDRRLGAAILAAWRNGAKLDPWHEIFSFDRWQAAFEETGLDADFYALRERGEEEVLPWDHIGGPRRKAVFQRSRERAFATPAT